MIDFRYHLVSLISVFLALAVGIVLGAGPLREPIGDSLTGQVNSLREDRNKLQTDLDTVRKETNQRNSYINALVPQLLTATLTGVDVAILTLPETRDSDTKLVIERLKQAGSNIVSQAKVTGIWSDPKKAKYLAALSSQITQYLSSPPASNASTATVLGAATAQILMKEPNETLTGLMTAKSDPVLSFSQKPAKTARVVVLVGVSRMAKEAVSEDKEKATQPASPYPDLAKALDGLRGGVVVVGSSNDENDLVYQLRSSETNMATVDAVGSTMAALSTPLAIANVLNGTKGAWGVEYGAKTVLPPKPTAVSPEPTSPNSTQPTQTPSPTE